MSTQSKYASPPVVEALCEVYFADSHWDDTIPGRFFDRVQPLGFVGKEPVQRNEVMIHLAGDSPATSVRQDTRMRFLTAERSRVVQVEPDLVVVNQLRPYPAFSAWAPTVTQVANIYSELTGARRLHRIALRYINQITLPGTRVDLDEWFQVSPRLPPAWNDAAGAFMVRVQRKMTEALGLTLTLGSAPAAEATESSFLLDLYAVMDLPEGTDSVSIAALLEEAHAGIESAFEGSITSRLRSRFRPADGS